MEELQTVLEVPITKILSIETIYMAPRFRPNIGLTTKSLFSGRKASKIALMRF